MAVDVNTSDEHRLWALSETYAAQQLSTWIAQPRNDFVEFPRGAKITIWVVVVVLGGVGTWLNFEAARPASASVGAACLLVLIYGAGFWLMFAALGLRRVLAWEAKLLAKAPLDGKFWSVASPVVYVQALFCLLALVLLRVHGNYGADAMLALWLGMVMLGFAAAMSAYIWRIRPIVVPRKWGKHYGTLASVNIVTQQVLIIVAALGTGVALLDVAPAISVATFFGSFGLAPFAALVVGIWVNIGIIRPLARANRMCVEVSQALGRCIDRVLGARLSGERSATVALALDELISAIDSSGTGESLGECNRAISICHMAVLAGARDELATVGLPRGGVVADSPTFQFQIEWMHRRYGAGFVTAPAIEVHHELINDVLRYLRQLKQHADRMVGRDW